MIKQATFNHNEKTWEFSSEPQHGRTLTVNLMDGYYIANAAGLVADFDLDEFDLAIMWVETKSGASNYTFTGRRVAII